MVSNTVLEYFYKKGSTEHHTTEQYEKEKERNLLTLWYLENPGHSDRLFEPVGHLWVLARWSALAIGITFTCSLAVNLVCTSMRVR